MSDSTHRFLKALTEWGAQRLDVLAIALVGSYARGTARPDSDIDIVLIVDSPHHYLHNSAWYEQLGTVLAASDEDWGLVQSKRVHYANGTEVEFGITDLRWSNTQPVDPGTRRVISDGLLILADPHGLLNSLLAAIAP